MVPIVIPSGRRERKKLDTRERLLQVALALFVAHGYEATSMDEIAERSDVSRGTVFNYFARKEDFLLAWIESRRAAARAVLARIDARSSTATRVRDALVAICRLHERDGRASRALVRCWLRCGGPLLEHAADTALLLRGVLRAGRARGDVRRDVSCDAAARAIHALYLGALYRWAADARLGSSTLTRDLLAGLDPYLRGLLVAPNPRRKS